MTHPLPRLMTAALAAAALTVAPITLAPSAVGSACLPGETGVTNGCAPFRLPGMFLNAPTGLCTKLPAPPPPPSAPMSNEVVAQ